MRSTPLTRIAAITAVAGLTLLAVPAGASSATQPAKRQPRWSISSAGRLPEGYLSAVTAPGRRAAWAVGHQRDASGRAHGVVLRWNGTSWQRVPAAQLPRLSYWHSVSASSPRNVWVYGWGQVNAAVARYDGTRWRQVPMPKLPEGASGSFAELATVHGVTWLTGESWVAAYTRGAWRTTNLGPGVDIRGIDARSSTDAWVAGYIARAGQGIRPYAAHWNGTTWARVPLPNTQGLLVDVYAESRRKVWVTGENHAGGKRRPVVWRWNGRAWKDVGLPNKGQFPVAISGNGDGKVWFVGDPAVFLYPHRPSLFWRYDGTRWHAISGALPAGARRGDGVIGLAPIHGTHSHWAVGSYTVDKGQVAHSFEFIQRDHLPKD